MRLKNEGVAVLPDLAFPVPLLRVAIICPPGTFCKAPQIDQSHQNQENFMAGWFFLALLP
jgi:hypothetical protein